MQSINTYINYIVLERYVIHSYIYPNILYLAKLNINSKKIFHEPFSTNLTLAGTTVLII